MNTHYLQDKNFRRSDKNFLFLNSPQWLNYEILKFSANLRVLATIQDEAKQFYSTVSRMLLCRERVVLWLIDHIF